MNNSIGIGKNFKYPMIILLSFLFTGVGIFGKSMPFCAAFIGSLSGFGCVISFTISTLGLILRDDGSDIIITLSSFIAIGAFRLIFGNKKSSRFELLSAIFTTFAVLISGFLCAEMPSELINSFTLAVLTGCCSYALMQCYKVFASGGYFSSLGSLNIGAAGVVSVFLVTALTGYEFGVVNLGIVLSAYLTLAFSEKYSFSGGAVCGSVSALGVAIGDGRYVETALVICAAGLASALFKAPGRLSQVSGFILTAGICSALLGVYNFPVASAFGVLMGSAVFFIVTPDKLTELFNRKPTERGSADISEIYAERLRLIGMAMSDVKQAVMKTAEILDKKSYHNYAWVYNSACDDVCEKCRNNMKCWGSEYGDTVKEMEYLIKKMRTGTQASAENLPLNISHRCNKKEMLADELNRRYREFTSVRAASRKLSEMRTILTAQLSATEKMLETMAADFSESVQYDKNLSGKAEEILESFGISDAKAIILISNGRLSLEAYGKGRLTCGRDRLCDLISESLRHEFDLPNIITNGKNFKLTMYERTVYSIECGSFQYSKSNKEASCGDYFDSFIDGRGRAFIILSDGMGSGGRARIDSTFACGMLVKLLQADVSLDSAIEIINNSLLVKSSDESFATLDICEIDLYTGKVTLYKAGSAPTYIKCNKQIVKAHGRGLPIGIAEKPQYERQSFTIGNSDVVIMTSDGAELSERWLEHELNKDSLRSSGMARVAEAVAGAAKFAAEKGREDDISVIAIKLVK